MVWVLLVLGLSLRIRGEGRSSVANHLFADASRLSKVTCPVLCGNDRLLGRLRRLLKWLSGSTESWIVMNGHTSDVSSDREDSPPRLSPSLTSDEAVLVH